MWYESMESQLQYENYCKLMDIVRPSMQDFRNATLTEAEQSIK